MQKGSTVICSQCGYKVIGSKVARCPRCFKLLVEYHGCSGNCLSCRKKH